MKAVRSRRREERYLKGLVKDPLSVRISRELVDSEVLEAGDAMESLIVIIF